MRLFKYRWNNKSYFANTFLYVKIIYIEYCILIIINILFKGLYVQYFSAKFYHTNQVTAMDYRLIIMFQNKIV